jgi:hypothetical protein
MRFTTPSIASAEKPIFANREVFVPDAWFPSPLLFRHPPLRCTSLVQEIFFVFALEKGRDPFAFVPVKETNSP